MHLQPALALVATLALLVVHDSCVAEVGSFLCTIEDDTDCTSLMQATELPARRELPEIPDQAEVVTTAFPCLLVAL